jgi:pimeloyl-ACP methyl ester carboxylesterase
MMKSNYSLAASFGIATAAVAIIGCLGVPIVATPTPAPTSTPLPPTPTPPPPTPTEPAYEPMFNREDCVITVPEGAQVECGFVVVPEQRNSNLIYAVKLSVVVYRSKDNDSDSIPVVFLQGGPGSGSVEWMSQRHYDEFISLVQEKHDVILFDSRGAGRSRPSLDCPEIKLLYVELLGQSISGAERERQYTEALTACRARLKKQGIDVVAYTSAVSAADVSDIVSALGYERVNLYAVSYGARVAQLIMRDYPELVNVVVMDSPVPLTAQIYNDSAARIEAALKTLFSGCAADSECSTAYPDLESVYGDIVRRLDEEPVTVPIPATDFSGAHDTTITGVDLTSDLIWGLTSSYVIPSLPKAIYDTAQADYEFVGYAESLPASAYSDISLGVMLSAHCSEQVFATTREQLTADLAAHPATEALGLSYIFGSADALFSICDMWGAPAYDEREREPLSSDIPTLILSGEYDPTTPPDYGRQIADTLSRSVVYVFPARGHVASLDRAKGCSLILTLYFLQTARAIPDDSCVTDMAGSAFFTPFTGAEEIDFVPYHHPDYRIDGIVPDGWFDIGYGFFGRYAYVFDPTQLGQQADPTKTEDWIIWLTDNFSGQGLDGEPELAGRHQANGLTWRLYTAAFKGDPVDLAFAETGDRTLLVAMLSNAEEHDALYDAVFLKAVDSLVPTE